MPPIASESERLQSFLHHVGIDSEGDKQVILQELMNLCMQSLGAIRILCTEIEGASRVLSASSLINREEGAQLTRWALRRTFSHAVRRMLRHIQQAEQPHSLDPARHVIESFPVPGAVVRQGWLAAHWAVLGDPDAEAEREAEGGAEAGGGAERGGRGFDERLVLLTLLLPSLPSALSERDLEGRTVAHIAARLSSPGPFLCLLRHMRREGGEQLLSSPNLNGALPLHNTARFSPCASLLDRIASACPAALRAVNNDGMLPLHWAAAKSRSLRVVRSLSLSNEQDMRRPNAEGYLPLHCAGQNECLEVVRFILERHPEAIRQRDAEGGLPLHHACCLNENHEVVRLLYEAHPQAITLPQEHDGVTPLHLAASQNESPEVIRFILSVCPQAPQLRDREGWCALHCLLSHARGRWTRRRLQCLDLIARAFPHVKDAYQAGLEDAAARIVLRHCGREQDLERYRALNWQAREGAVWLLVSLSRAKAVRLKEEGLRVRYTVQLLRACANNNMMGRSRHGDDDSSGRERDIPAKAEAMLRRDACLLGTLELLVRRFMNPLSLAVPSGVLRKIVAFL